MRHRIECIWDGCDGVIDLDRDLFAYSKFDGKKPSRISWSIHTIICPKCHNIVGEFNINPSCWVSYGKAKAKDGWGKPVYGSINLPKTGKKKRIKDSINGKMRTVIAHKQKKWDGKKLDSLTIKDYKPYLKKWAR